MSNETTPTHEWPTDSELDVMDMLAKNGIAPPLTVIHELIAGCRDRNRLERVLNAIATSHPKVTAEGLRHLARAAFEGGKS